MISNHHPYYTMCCFSILICGKIQNFCLCVLSLNQQLTQPPNLILGFCQTTQKQIRTNSFVKRYNIVQTVQTHRCYFYGGSAAQIVCRHLSVLYLMPLPNMRQTNWTYEFFSFVSLVKAEIPMRIASEYNCCYMKLL